MPFVAKRVFDHDPVKITAAWGMRDLEPGMAYSVCNSLQCVDCGALFLDIRFSEAEMAALYTGYREEAYVALRERFEPGYRNANAVYAKRAEYLATIEEFLRPRLAINPVILDWGGDNGLNTPLRDEARLVHIYDISGKDPVPGTTSVSYQTARSTRYDLITCSQVLEHVPFPRELIAEIAVLMHRDTLLYVEVPYEPIVRAAPDSKELYLAKRHWHEHINFFPESSLKALIDKTGLVMVEMRSFEISLGARNACVQSVLCRRA